MGRFISALFLVLMLFLCSLVISSPVLAYYSGMPASVVIGQSDFGSISSNQGGTAGANTLNRPTGAFVSGGKLFVTDRINSRVLIYNNIPTTNNASADVVIGQTTFSGSSGNQGGTAGANTLKNPWMTFVDGTRMYVSDFSNHRVLIWNKIPTASNTPADVVVGQTNFSNVSSNQGGSRGSNTLSSPESIWSDGNKLIIGDTGNTRVLIYNTIPTSNNASANVVVGQTDFSGGSCDQGGSTAANTIRGLGGVWSDGKKLLVADKNNHRILIFNSIPTSNNASADVVIGQPDFTSNGFNQGLSAPAANTFSQVIGLMMVGNRLFVSEMGDTLLNYGCGTSPNSDPYAENNRILIFNSLPTTNNASADIVIGQPNFTTASRTSTGTAGLIDARFFWADSQRLIVPNDQDNSTPINTGNRLLIFNNVIATPEITFGSVDNISNGKLRMKGNVKLGESGHYDLGLGGGFTFSINGADGAGVNTIGLASSDGAGSNFWEYSNDFEPWANSNGSKDDWLNNFDELRATRGFSIKLSVKSSNTDSSRFFYFEPFNMLSIAGGIARFQVSKYQIDRIKENVSYFEIQTKKGKENWKTYLTNISTDKIGSNGMVSAVTTSSLPPGDYQVKAVSVTKDSNLKQYSSILTTSLTSQIASITYINPNKYALTTGQWYPIQINGIPAGTNPTINGVAYAGSTVALRVTDAISGNTSDFYTTVKSDSSFSVTPTLYSSSILTFSVYDINGRYNELSPISVRGY